MKLHWLSKFRSRLYINQIKFRIFWLKAVLLIRNYRYLLKIPVPISFKMFWIPLLMQLSKDRYRFRFITDNYFVSGDPAQESMDTVLLLSEDSAYVAQYDQELEGIADIQQIQLADITRIEFGQLEPVPPALSSSNNTSNTAANSGTTFNLPFLAGGSSGSQRAKEVQPPPPFCVRIWYRGGVSDGGGDCLTLRSAGFRFFNNLPIQLENDDERIESLKAVADAVAVAMEAAGLVPDMWFGNLEPRRRTPAAAGSSLPGSDQILNDEFNTAAGGESTGRPGGGGRLRNAGVAAALSNVTSQISRFNPIGKLMRPSPQSSSEIRFTDLQARVLIFDKFDKKGVIS
jgi:Inositol phosphatase